LLAARASADRSGIGTMSEEELALMALAREAYLSLMAIPCTACQSCLPCPQGVAIPDLFDIYNGHLMFREEERSRMFCSWIDERARVDACIECGCRGEVTSPVLEKCSQGIDIPEWMKKVHEALGSDIQA
jgi:predicted aldo/keto reductase-like oxidoreductase